MFDIRSRLTQTLRRAAGLLPPENCFRQGLSAAWSRILRLTSEHVTISINGHPIRVRVSHRHLSPNYETETLKVWLRLLQPGSSVWDVGANLGLYSILSSQIVGPTGSVVAWEPAPATFQILQDHLEANGVNGWCQAVQEAIADKQGGTVPFVLLPGHEANMANRISSAGAKTVDVPVGTLDQWLDRLERVPQFVKIDIEGAEVLALRGAGKLLAPGGPRPVMLVAVHPLFLAEFGCSTNDLPPLLDQYRYECRDLSGKIAGPTELTEYLFLPTERADATVSRLFA